MPISLTSLVSGANRLIAARSRGRQAGEERRMQMAARDAAIQRQAMLDALTNARIRDAERPERPAALRLGDPGYLEARAAELRQEREINPPRPAAPRRAPAARAAPEFTQAELDEEIANEPPPADEYAPQPSEAQLARNARRRLRARRAAAGAADRTPAPSEAQRAWDALPGTAEVKRARVGPRPTS